MGIRDLIRSVKRWGDTPELRVVHVGTTGTGGVGAAGSGGSAVRVGHGSGRGVGLLDAPSTPVAGTSGGQTAPAPLSPELLAPIAGVTVEQYVAVSKGIAAHNYDQAMLATVAADLGIDAAVWETAAAGFNARLSTSPAFARHFNALYRAARPRAS